MSEDKPKKSRVQKLIKKYNRLRAEIEIELSNLENYMGECHCTIDNDAEETVDLGELDGYDNIIVYCAKCGGLIR